MFVVTISFFSSNAILLNTVLLKCFSINNLECRIRPEIININSNKPIFYPYVIKVNKYSSSNINDPYSKLCVPDVVENIYVKVFNPMSKTN